MSRPSILNFVFSSIKTIPGIGNKTYDKLKQKIGDRVLDLLFFLPKNVKIWHRIINIDQTYIGKHVIFYGTVIHHIVRKTNTSPYCIVVLCNNQPVHLLFFLKNIKFLIKKFPIGSRAIFAGKLLQFSGVYQIIHPTYDNQDSFSTYEVIYPGIQGISLKKLHKIIEYVISNLPARFPLKNIFWDIHHPQSIQEISPDSNARKILAYQEILAFQIQLLYRQYQIKNSYGFSVNVNENLRNNFLQQLPFKLTESQKKALDSIDYEMKKSVRMIHLLQGDVGSGKTIIAILAGLSAMSNGMQMVILVPTAILAQQHATTISSLLKPFNLKTTYITKSNKKDLHAIKNGEISCIIGTHALLNDEIQYHQLALIVIDEQHRFGVSQRLSIIRKENHAHILIMTATPIPRTLALFLYSGMSISFLKDKPKERKHIQTCFLNESKILLLIKRLHLILQRNEKIFWICPLIEDCEKLIKLTSIDYRLKFLKKYFDESILFVMHGKMPDKKKEFIMQSFLKSSKGILLATSVIEVGINVPDATVMIIENPEQFGLAALHQLRGRLARGSLPGYCILLINSSYSENSIKRLTIFKKISNGMLLAEEDLKQRGMGDIFGLQQSGLPFFHFVNFSWHQELFVQAKSEAEMILKKYPDLNNYEIQVLLWLFSYNNTFILWNN